MSAPDRRLVIGWDIGGAHVKACLLRDGRVAEVAQWACPLWQGLEHLERVLHLAHAHWPQLGRAAHAVTMTGEMTDLFEHREDGVQRIAASLARLLAPAAPDALHFFAGDAHWCRAAEVGTHWAQIASANWLATAAHAAQCIAEGVLIDIGSTTTDLIAFRGGRVLTDSRTDAQRLARGELVYHGVVRTPLCAVAQRIDWRGTPHNVMNEFFATAADVYRLTGELNPAHDLHPSADTAPKDLPATRQRLARMIGLDQRDAAPDDWLAFARSWREAQVAELGGQLHRVIVAHGLGPQAVVVSAGCGDFLVRDVLAAAIANGGSTTEPSPGRPLAAYGVEVASVAAHASAGRSNVQTWAQVCAPCVATATLFDRDSR